MEECFDKHKPEVAKALMEAFQEASAAEEEAKTVEEILADLNFDGWAILFDDMQPLLEEVAKHGAYRALAQVEVSEEGITDLVNEDAVAWSRFRAAEMVGKRYDAETGTLVDNPNAEWVITDSTRTYLRSTVTDAMEEGWSNDRLAKEISENAGFSADRAETIARTETAFADANGRLIGYQRSGLNLKKEWILGDNHDDDDECDDNEAAGPIDLDDEFPSGDQVPPGHPRCICDYTVSLFEDEEENGEDDSE